MNKNLYNGLPLIRRSQANLEWWLNSSHSQKISRQGFKQLLEIFQGFEGGIENLYHFKRFELAKTFDLIIDRSIQLDPLAQGIDSRTIIDLPKNGILDEGRIIKAPSINYNKK